MPRHFEPFLAGQRAPEVNAASAGPHEPQLQAEQVKSLMHRVRLVYLLHVGLLVTAAIVVAYYGVVFTGPLPDHPWLMGWNDTFLHVCAFGLLTLLILPLTCARLVPLLVLAAGAAAIEGIQLAVPVRTASLGDVAASLTGIGLAWLLVESVRWATPQLFEISGRERNWL